MPDKAWKQFERTVAKWFGGKRRGPDVTGGKTDVIAEGWAIECKLLGAPTYGAMLAACRQAEENGHENELPVAVVKRKSAQVKDALVVMRLETFSEWFLAGQEADDRNSAPPPPSAQTGDPEAAPPPAPF